MCKPFFMRHWRVTIILTTSFQECWEETQTFQVWGKVFLWRAALPLQSLDSPVLGDGWETLIEQTLPVKIYTPLGASRDIYSQVCLNGHNSWATAPILQTAPKKKRKKNNRGNSSGGAGKVPLLLFMQHLSLPGTDDSLFTSTPGASQKEQDMSMSWHECNKKWNKSYLVQVWVTCC